MRHRSTKERRIDRVEFVYMYRVEIAELSKLDKYTTPNCKYVNEKINDFVARYARKHLEYKANTYSIDIFNTLVRTYENIKLLLPCVTV